MITAFKKIDDFLQKQFSFYIYH